MRELDRQGNAIAGSKCDSGRDSGDSGDYNKGKPEGDRATDMATDRRQEGDYNKNKNNGDLVQLETIALSA
jgi:hypothetical protein